MRGALCIHGGNHDKFGIIPAYAGSTRRASSGAAARRDHPRVCGEHKSDMPRTLYVTGSSPRMRGALAKSRLHTITRGIIPAYAGSTIQDARC